MKSLALVIGASVLLAVGTATASAQTAPTTVEGLLFAAKNAAGLEWPGTYLRLCIPPPPAAPTPAAGAARGGARGTPPGPPARETWYAEPAKVADNLYFLGTKIHNAWAIVGTQGIIVIEALFDYAAQEEILGGIRKLGLDTSKIKYVILSHAHGDHDGGAKLLQDEIPGVRLVYGAADWDLVEKSANRPGGKPERDMVGADGMRIAVGDASVQIVTMPGHTAGTLSYLFEVRDNGKPLRVAYVGGTAIPFNSDAAVLNPPAGRRNVPPRLASLHNRFYRTLPTAQRSLILPSAACGRNQVEGFGWPRAVSRQRSAISLAFQHSASASTQ